MIFQYACLFCKLHQCIFHSEIIDSLRTDTRYKNNILSTQKLFFVQTAYFSDQSCRAVTHDTVADLFAHGNPYSVLFLPIAAQIHDQVSVYKGFSILIAVFKIRVLFQRFHKFSEIP